MRLHGSNQMSHENPQTTTSVASQTSVDNVPIVQQLTDALTSLPKFKDHKFLHPTQNFFDEDDRVLDQLFGTDDFSNPAVKSLFQWRHASQSLTYALRSLFSKIANERFSPAKFEASAGPIAVLADGIVLLNDQFPSLSQQLSSLDLRKLDLTALINSAASGSTKISTLSAISFGTSAVKMYPLLKQYTQQLMSFVVALRSSEVDEQAKMFSAACLAIAIGDSRLLRSFVKVYGFLPPHISASTKGWDSKKFETILVEMKDELIYYFGADSVIDVINIIKDLFSLVASNSDDSMSEALSTFENNINFLNK